MSNMYVFLLDVSNLLVFKTVVFSLFELAGCSRKSVRSGRKRYYSISTIVRIMHAQIRFVVVTENVCIYDVSNTISSLLIHVRKYLHLNEGKIIV